MEAHNYLVLDIQGGLAMNVVGHPLLADARAAIKAMAEDDCRIVQELLDDPYDDVSVWRRTATGYERVEDEEITGG